MAFIQTVHTKTKGKVSKVHYTDPITGKRRTKSFPRRKDAIVFIESPKFGAEYGARQATFKTAIDNWLETCRLHGRKGREPVAKSTLRQYEGHANILVSAAIPHGSDRIVLGDCRLEKLDKSLCKSIRLHLIETYSWQYARKLLTSFKSIVAQAREDDLMNHVPEENMFIRKPRRDPAGQGSPEKMMQLDEAQILFRAVRQRTNADYLHQTVQRLRYRLMIETIGYGGTRPGEALGLPWKGVDFEQGGIHISQDADEGEIGLPKTDASFRFIPMPEAYLRRLAYWRELCPHPDHELVFPNHSGNIEFLSNFNKRGWKPAMIAAGLATDDGRANYPPKSLRHFRASVEINEGANPKEIQNLMGHSSIRTTFDHYGHLFDAHSETRSIRAEKIEALINSA
tara:strand:+ start:1121 stop:2314 length:1194 start_codon:yes stop_codon:yes gene_type:complete